MLSAVTGGARLPYSQKISVCPHEAIRRFAFYCLAPDGSSLKKALNRLLFSLTGFIYGHIICPEKSVVKYFFA